MGRTLIVAMDGPAGAGKSTVARRVAQSLGFTLLDTGALYRTVAFAAERKGIAWSDVVGCERVAADVVSRGVLRLQPAEGSGLRVLLEGVDVGEAIRTPSMSMGASTVSAIPGVRAALLDLQRNFAKTGDARGVVAEGRDIGTVVFPDADVKVFLTASVEERARRRHRELAAKGSDVTFEQTRDEVAARDAQDSGRAIAPLRKADDAIEIDTTACGIDEAVSRVLSLVSEKTKAAR
jgi:cytidylate kinase